MSFRRNIVAILLCLSMTFAVLQAPFESTIAFVSTFLHGLYLEVCGAIFQLSHGSLGVNQWVMFTVACVLVFFRVRRKHQSVFSWTRVSYEIQAIISVAPAADVECAPFKRTAGEVVALELASAQNEAAMS